MENCVNWLVYIAYPHYLLDNHILTIIIIRPAHVASINIGFDVYYVIILVVFTLTFRIARYLYNAIVMCNIGVNNSNVIE